MTTKTHSKNGTTNRISDVVVEVPSISIERIDVEIVGISPLLCHNWSDDALEEMKAKAEGRQVAKRKIHDPIKEVADSLYWISEKPDDPVWEDIQAATLGVTVRALKNCIVSACRMVPKMKMTEVRNAVHFEDVGELIEIIGEVEHDERAVKIGKGAKVCHRGRFTNWSANLSLSFSTGTITKEELLNLVNLAGWGEGIGDWRPAKSGPFGRFKIA